MDKNRFEALGILPPLEEGEVSLAEVNCELLTAKNEDDENITKYLNAEGVIYPHIMIPSVDPMARQRPPKRTHTGSSVMTKLYNWWTDPLGGTPQETRRYGKTIKTDQPRKRIQIYRNVGVETETVKTEEKPEFRYFPYFTQEFNMYEKMPPTLAPDPMSLCSSMAWHIYIQKIAIALRDDRICLYDLNLASTSPITLSHEFQKDILCMSWKPTSGNTLAVGCQYGVCVWKILRQKATPPPPLLDPPHLLAFVPPFPLFEDQTSFLRYLRFPGHAPVNCMAWSPDGRFLATGTINSSTVLIWDTQTSVPTSLQYPSKGTTVLKWSPNGNLLFVGGIERSVVWETMTWNYEPWKNFHGNEPCQAACWSRDSSSLALAFANHPILYFIQYIIPHYSSTIPLSGKLIHKENLIQYFIDREGQESVGVCGSIMELAWDGSEGQGRLAVSFCETKFIALFATVEQPKLSLVPFGFICGPPLGGIPRHLSFRPNFPRGALLTACYSNGKVLFFPMYFGSGQPHMTSIRHIPVEEHAPWARDFIPRKEHLETVANY